MSRKPWNWAQSFIFVISEWAKDDVSTLSVRLALVEGLASC